MATGSTDYWFTQANFLSSLMSAVKDTLTPGGSLMTLLDSMDGKLDAAVDLSTLEAAQAAALTKLTGIEAGVIPIADIVTAVDNLDGKLDGSIDLTGLNADMVTALANLLGIQTSVQTGGNLIAKLDALDGTMDGKLDLAQLNTSELWQATYNSYGRLGTILTNTGHIWSETADTVTQLTATLVKLTDLLASNLTQEEYQRAIYPEGWQVVPDTEEFIAPWDADRRYWKIHADVNNTCSLYIAERQADDTFIRQQTLAAGEEVEKHYNSSKLYGKAMDSGETAGFLKVIY